ncbi:hypothetical protein ONZ45_g16564 [Pleurotus djamor]|nr:hypothetical protein ONZ45_g16564 [Pleurotus djamor]
MDDNDPIHQFFPGQEEVDLYAVLNVPPDSKLDAIKKSYRRLALQFHPDKHAAADEHAKADASLKFQQIGFSYAVLSDDKRRTRYDKTGKTDEGFDLNGDEAGWEAYFEDLFDQVTRGKLDEMKKEYHGSSEEIKDLKQAYLTTDGNIGEIMTHIPHSTHDDEARFVVLVSDLIKAGALPSLPQWEKSTKDEKARLVRKKQSEKEAKEAEKLAKDLGVWDEFYGSGKVGKRQGKGKASAKGAESGQDDEEDVSALQALILKKKEKNMDSFFDNLANKYAPTKKKGKGKRSHEDSEEESPKKKGKLAPPSEEEFSKIQQRLFGDSSDSKKREGKKKGKRKAKS